MRELLSEPFALSASLTPNIEEYLKASIICLATKLDFRFHPPVPIILLLKHFLQSSAERIKPNTDGERRRLCSSTVAINVSFNTSFLPFKLRCLQMMLDGRSPKPSCLMEIGKSMLWLSNWLEQKSSFFLFPDGSKQVRGRKKGGYGIHVLRNKPV